MKSITRRNEWRENQHNSWKKFSNLLIKFPKTNQYIKHGIGIYYFYFTFISILINVKNLINLNLKKENHCNNLGSSKLSTVQKSKKCVYSKSIKFCKFKN